MYQLHVLLTYMYISATCTPDLYVHISYMYLWPICTYQLHVLLTYMYISATCTHDLYVHISYMYSWPLCTYQLHVHLTYMYISAIGYSVCIGYLSYVSLITSYKDSFTFKQLFYPQGFVYRRMTLDCTLLHVFPVQTIV